MKKTYEAPEIVLSQLEKRDVITTSGGDMPTINLFRW